MRLGALAAWVCLLAAGGVADDGSPAGPTRAPVPAVRHVSLRASIERVIERRPPLLDETPRQRQLRLGRFLGLYGYAPAGGSGYGIAAPPLQLFPDARVGNSLNVDPITGRPFAGIY